MRLNHDSRFTIQGLLVHEFGYLLRAYSGNKLADFDNFEAVAEATPDIVAAIEADYDAPLEADRLMIGLATAQGNLSRLADILLTIRAYVAECRRLGREDRVVAGTRYGQ